MAPCLRGTPALLACRAHSPFCSAAACGRTRAFLDVLDAAGEWTGLSGFKDALSAAMWADIQRRVRQDNYTVRQTAVQCYNFNNLLQRCVGCPAG